MFWYLIFFQLPLLKLLQPRQVPPLLQLQVMMILVTADTLTENNSTLSLRNLLHQKIIYKQNIIISMNFQCGLKCFSFYHFHNFIDICKINKTIFITLVITNVCFKCRFIMKIFFHEGLWMKNNSTRRLFIPLKFFLMGVLAVFWI